MLESSNKFVISYDLMNMNRVVYFYTFLKNNYGLDGIVRDINCTSYEKYLEIF